MRMSCWRAAPNRPCLRWASAASPPCAPVDAQRRSHDRFASLGPRPRRLRAGRGRRRAGAGRVRTRQARRAHLWRIRWLRHEFGRAPHHGSRQGRPAPRILNALRNGGLNLDDIQYVNAHGTSTPLGDKNESEALKLAFGDHAKKLVVNSTKSMTGHLLGAAGGIEAVFTTLAVYNRVASHDQYLQSGSGMRSGLLRQRGAANEDRRGAVELLRFRRHQRLDGRSPGLTWMFPRAGAGPCLPW